MSKNIITLAENFAKELHKGQFRRGGNQDPYITHPFKVRDICVKNGYDDPETQAIAILHDTIEDTEVFRNKRHVLLVFGESVYYGVYTLSNNTVGKHTEEFQKIGESLGIKYVDVESKLTEEAYKLRILFSRDRIKRIKIADMIHNTSSLSNLSRRSIERKIRDAQEFYIPLGKCIAPIMVKELETNINNYLKSSHYKETFNS